jgi:hypothetical protein
MRRRPSFFPYGLMLTVGVFMAVIGAADATEPKTRQHAAACDDSDVLHKATVTVRGAYRGTPERLVDGKLPREGTLWQDNAALRLPEASTSILFDLGGMRTIGFFHFQGDYNDDYLIEASIDEVTWQKVWQVPRGQEVGLRSRFQSLGESVHTRYLRVTIVGGDGKYSVSEFRGYCRKPDPWPSTLETIPGPGLGKRLRATYERTFGGWSLHHTRAWIGLAGCLCLGLLFFAHYRRPKPRRPRLRKALFILVGIGGLFAWFGSANVGYVSGVNIWDTYHHYLGAKYARELGYKNLYLCTVVADLAEEKTSLTRRTLRRQVRDLRSRRIVRGELLAKNGDSCLSRFTPQRWQAFRADVAWFRKQMKPSQWARIQVDYGYNATPVWTIAGRAVSSLGPVSWNQMRLLSTFDYLLLLAMSLLVWRVFGGEAVCILWFVFGTCYPMHVFINHGTFLRQGWIFLVVASLSALKTGRMATAGAALTYATLLRGFPGLLFVGIGIKIVRHMVSERRLTLSSGHRRFLVASAIAAIVLCALATWTTGGTKVWPEYLNNAKIYTETPWDHDIGLKTVISYDSEERLSRTYRRGSFNVLTRWTKARQNKLAERRWLFYLFVIVFLLLLDRVVRKEDDWSAALLCAGLLPIATGFASYYQVLLIVYALLYRRSFAVAFGLALMAGATALAYLFNAASDELAHNQSLMIVGFVLFATWCMGNKERATRKSLSANEGVDGE